VKDKTSSQIAIANKQVPRGHNAAMILQPGYMAKASQAGIHTTMRQGLPILHSDTVSSQWMAIMPTTTHGWLAEILERQQPCQGESGSSSSNLSCVVSWAGFPLLEASEPELAEMLQDIDLHKRSMRALASGSDSDHNTRLAHLQRTAAVKDKTNKWVPRGHDASMIPQPGYVAKASQAGDMPTRSRSVDSQQDCTNPSEKEQEIIGLLLETRNRRRKNNKPALSRPASFDLVAESAHRFQRTTDDSQPTQRETPRKTERSHQRSLERFLSRRSKDSAQHSPGSPWHVKDQHRRQQLFLNRRAALYRSPHPIISYSSASSDHSTVKTIKVPSGRC